MGKFKSSLSEAKKQIFYIWFPRKNPILKGETSAISDKEALTKLITRELLTRGILYKGRTFNYSDRAILLKTIFDEEDWDSTTDLPKKK